ncbi:MAG: DUF4296 domain-containing protein, partial [Bacteroidales bacterium]|nr:DUF4296 domain-containing protein [Bacteroidales bacterium]
MSALKKIIILFAVIALSVACVNQQKPKAVPKHILGKEQMADIICDLHIADGMLTAGVISESKMHADTVLYRAVFAKHNTTSKKFQESILYYTGNDMPSLKLIYADAVEKLNQQKTQLMGNN